MHPAPGRNDSEPSGLDESELFGDLTDLSTEQRAGSEPVRGPLVETPVPRATSAANDPESLSTALDTLDAEGSAAKGSWRWRAAGVTLAVVFVAAAALWWFA